ncbi:MAG: glycosyltransferase family 1 protein [Pseudobdellovibrionaceae bacterium]
MGVLCSRTDLLVFSHLRWDFVYQRPQHLMSRFAKFRKVFFIEEPAFGLSEMPTLHIRSSTEGVIIVTPHFPHQLEPQIQELSLTHLLNDLIEDENLSEYSLWYYTPMALEFSRHLKPLSIIYDCMDELSLFNGCPPSLIELEKELFALADVVFTGGHSLYEAKQNRHHNIHPMPSSIDYDHFFQARSINSDPVDQADIPHPRLGFFGVIDERMDIELLAKIADLRPHWHFVMIGPVVKIEPETLPLRKNIHYLGKKSYQELPFYLAGWDCALMPFALNDSTRFISPTKTPEYLAAGKPVVSTAIRDVVNPYGKNRLVHIAETAEEFVDMAEMAMREAKSEQRLRKVNKFLENISWDHTWNRMAELELKVDKVKPALVL